MSIILELTFGFCLSCVHSLHFINIVEMIFYISVGPAGFNKHLLSLDSLTFVFNGGTIFCQEETLYFV